MFEIIEAKHLAPNIYEFVVAAPDISRKARPGQFVVLRLHERGERIPLTLKDWDPKQGTITLVFQAVGKTTFEMARLKAGDAIMDLLGPLGIPPTAERYGTACVVTGGVGAASALPRARQLKEAGNYLITILGARTADLLICEEELRQTSDELIITTDDGSRGIKGVVTLPLKQLLEEGRRIDYVFTVGPAIMMKFVAATTRPYGIRTEASLNPIMLDGTGMCGACRVEVAGETRFACVDGPEFDAHQVNFDLLLQRLNTYRDQERLALERYQRESK